MIGGGYLGSKSEGGQVASGERVAMMTLHRKELWGSWRREQEVGAVTSSRYSLIPLPHISWGGDLVLLASCPTMCCDIP